MVSTWTTDTLVSPRRNWWKEVGDKRQIWSWKALLAAEAGLYLRNHLANTSYVQVDMVRPDLYFEMASLVAEQIWSGKIRKEGYL